MTRINGLRILTLSMDAQFGKGDAPTVHTTKLAEGMVQQGCDVTVLMCGERSERNTVNGLDIVTTAMPDESHSTLMKVIDLVWKNFHFYKVAKRYVPAKDCIYERHNIVVLAGIAVSKRYRKPLYFEVNSLNVEETLDGLNIKNSLIRKVSRAFMRWELRQAEGIYVQTKELAALVQKYYGPLPVSVVHNGSETSNVEVRQLYDGNRPLECVYVGTLDEYHSIDKLLRVFTEVHDHATLTVVGGGPRLDIYKRRYESSKNVNFKGPLTHDKAMECVVRSDLGIAQYNLSSEHFKKYGFYFCPMKMVEYAAAGKSTIYIGTPNSFVHEFEDHSACILIDQADNLQKVLTSLIRSPKELIKLSRNAKEFGATLSWKEIARQTVKGMYV